LSARRGEFRRKTREVDIVVSVELEGRGEFDGSTGSAFIDHMLRTLSKHSLMDIRLTAGGDLKHHIIEDSAIALGKALSAALGGKMGIGRFGYAYAPMDDSLARAVVDLGGRAYSRLELGIRGESVEDTKAEDIIHFLKSLSESMQCNLHIRVLYGTNDHHKVEAAVKALALALRGATALTGKGLPSAKGEI